MTDNSSGCNKGYYVGLGEISNKITTTGLIGEVLYQGKCMENRPVFHHTCFPNHCFTTCQKLITVSGNDFLQSDMDWMDGISYYLNMCLAYLDLCK